MKGSVCLKNKKTYYLKSRYIYLIKHISITSIQFQYKFDNCKSFGGITNKFTKLLLGIASVTCSQYQIHFKRIPDSWFVNNSNLISLKNCKQLKHAKSIQILKHTETLKTRIVVLTLGGFAEVTHLLRNLQKM